MSRVTCQVSHIVRHLSPVTCHMSLMPTATATNPPHAADLDLDPYKMCCVDQKTRGDFNFFLAKITKFGDQLPFSLGLGNLFLIDLFYFQPL